MQARGDSIHQGYIECSPTHVFLNERIWIRIPDIDNFDKCNPTSGISSSTGLYQISTFFKCDLNTESNEDFGRYIRFYEQ